MQVARSKVSLLVGLGEDRSISGQQVGCKRGSCSTKAKRRAKAETIDVLINEERCQQILY